MTADLPENDARRIVTQNTMLKVGGRRFYCACGANVFTKWSDDIYDCNGCDLSYKGESESAAAAIGGST